MFIVLEQFESNYRIMIIIRDTCVTFFVWILKKIKLNLLQLVLCFVFCKKTHKNTLRVKINKLLICL